MDDFAWEGVLFDINILWFRMIGLITVGLENDSSYGTLCCTMYRNKIIRPVSMEFHESFIHIKYADVTLW
jgi:hypothetical protein